MRTDQRSARMPRLSISYSPATPRMNGSDHTRLVYTRERSRSLKTVISPSGRRAATAKWRRPRISTPSITACPP